MTEYEAFLRKRGTDEESIQDDLEHMYFVKPTGIDQGVEIIKEEAPVLVYYFKKPIEDALGTAADEAKKNGNIYDFYGDWLYDTMEKIESLPDYGRKYLQEADTYVKKHGIFKAEFR